MVNDIFGVRMIYPTVTGSNNHEWFLNSQGTNLFGESTSRGSDSEGTYYTINSTQVRASALTRHGYNAGSINSDHGELDLNVGGSGHMMSQGGFRDVEMTGYFFVTSSADDDFVEYCRGGRHSDDSCEGFAYKAAINYLNGQCRVRKEQWHSSGYVSADWRAAFGSSIRNRWVGFKFICVNRGSAPNINVYMECWVDKANNNSWERIYTFTDSGQSAFGGDGGRCGGVTNQRGTWSGPLATFRWDTSGVRFKKLSVREIKESGNFEPPPPGPGPGPGPGPPPPPGEDPHMRLVYPSSSITASSNDGNLPANVNDQNLGTRWSSVAGALPAWIKIDMLELRTVGYVRIAFYRGNERTVSFNIELSADNQAFSQVSSGSSSGTTTDFERFDFTDANARFVRVNVISNSQNNWASISEIEVWGLGYSHRRAAATGSVTAGSGSYISLCSEKAYLSRKL